jgi:hypothetical protein
MDMQDIEIIAKDGDGTPLTIPQYLDLKVKQAVERKVFLYESVNIEELDRGQLLTALREASEEIEYLHKSAIRNSEMNSLFRSIDV